jgi:hypothetical protein
VCTQAHRVVSSSEVSDGESEEDKPLKKSCVFFSRHIISFHLENYSLFIFSLLSFSFILFSLIILCVGTELSSSGSSDLEKKKESNLSNREVATTPKQASKQQTEQMILKTAEDQQRKQRIATVSSFSSFSLLFTQSLLNTLKQFSLSSYTIQS